MANEYQREPTDGGDSGVWGEKELKQNRMSLGVNSCRLYDDSGTLKITVGRIGFDNGSSNGTVIVDTVTSISLGASTSIWLKIEVSVSGSTPTFAATAIPGATDPGTVPAGFTGAFDNTKGGYYMIATARTLGLAWVNAAGTLEGVINSLPVFEGYQGYSLTDDALDQKYTWFEIAGLEYDADYMGRPYMLPEDERPASAILNGGTATIFTDVDFSSYVPSGVKALILYVITRFTGDGALDDAELQVRANGSAETAQNKLRAGDIYHFNAPAGSYYGSGSYMVVLCDSSGIIEYLVDAATTQAFIYLRGYYL